MSQGMYIAPVNIIGGDIKRNTDLTSMLNSCGDQLPVLDHCPEHLRYRVLLEHPVLLALHRQADIDAAALRGRDLHTEAVLRQVDLP